MSYYILFNKYKKYKLNSQHINKHVLLNINIEQNKNLKNASLPINENLKITSWVGLPYILLLRMKSIQMHQLTLVWTKTWRT